MKEKYSKVSAQFIVNVTSDEKKKRATSLSWEHTPEKRSKTPGVYCIRTNQVQLNNKEIWATYRMLNDIEDKKGSTST